MPSKPHRNKRPRHPDSVGCHSPSPGPPLSGFDNPAKRFHQLLSDHVMNHSPAAQDSDNLACPFVKHNPGRYAYVVNSCTETGFKDVGSLRDHIKRVHSRKYGCTECHSHRFNCGKKQLSAAKTKHQSQKECKDAKKKREDREDREDASEPEWMTEEQEREYDKLDLRRSRLDNLEESFREIYTHLWPECKADLSTIPAHCYGSGFLVSMFVIDQIFEKLSIGSTRRRSLSRLPSQQLPYEQDTTETEDDPSPPPPPEEHLAGMLGTSPFDYPTYVNDPTAAPFMANGNNTSYAHSMYANPGTYLSSENYSQPGGLLQFNGGNDQFVMSPFYDDSATQADEPRVPPFPYTIPVSTNPSQQDSAYGTTPSDENEGYKTQQQQQQPHHHYHGAALQVTDWAALHHAGPTGPEHNPPTSDDIHLDEEGAVEDFGYLSGCLPT
ncbi:hypothetical protein PG997_009559 [Apiospora hydei]|uniref:C2H2-type domain-containing protein n=1 Tax=Apiospora hydei TaxID=1337664 RepID=A0ABR1VUH3_9PEZI